MTRAGLTRLLPAVLLFATLVACSSEDEATPPSVAVSTSTAPASAVASSPAPSSAVPSGEVLSEQAMCTALSTSTKDAAGAEVKSPIERLSAAVGAITQENADPADFPTAEELAEIRDSFADFATRAPETMAPHLVSASGFTQELIEVLSGVRTAAQLSDDFRSAGYKLAEICTQYR